MKFSLIAALVVVLALAQGSKSASLPQQDAFDIEKLSQYFRGISDLISKTSEDIVEKLKAHELTGQAQAYLEEGKSQLQPLAEKFQEQLKPLEDNIKQLQPLTDSMQAQFKPLVDSMQAQLEDLWKQFVQQTKAVASK